MKSTATLWTPDLLAALLLATVSALLSYWCSRQFNRAIYDLSSINVWFDGDVPRVFENMTRRFSDHYRTRVHPLYSLVTTPAVYVIRAALRKGDVAAVQVFLAMTAAVWGGSFYTLLRLLGGRRPDSVVFTLLALSSSSMIFWIGLPEYHLYGSLSFILASVLIAAGSRTRFEESRYTVACAITLSMTLTNWMLGLAAVVLRYRSLRCIQIIANALTLVVVLWAVQNIICPSSAFFLGKNSERQYTYRPSVARALEVGRVYFLDSLTMPRIDTVRIPDNNPKHLVLSIQNSPAGSGTGWGRVPLAAWVAILGTGLVGLLQSKSAPIARLVLILTLAGGFALHVLYGAETFVYLLNYLPLLVATASFGAQTRLRWVVVGLAAAVAAMNAANNLGQFQKAVVLFDKQFSSEQDAVLAEMWRRPDDPWPRGIGHVVIAEPGSPAPDKGYHEPGGSFSPGAGSFGIALWVVDDQGKPRTTSDAIPLDQIRQRWNWPSGGGTPAIRTETAEYRATWSKQSDRRWILDLEPGSDTKARTDVVIRSVGPAGGPVRSLDWDGSRLSINGRWELRATPAPSKVVTGREGAPGWTALKEGEPRRTDADGWGVARLVFPASGTRRLTLVDTSPTPAQSPADAGASELRSGLDVNLPDERFVECLNAQVTQLLMGTVGRETRPADPISYPLHWLRDGVYVLSALSRAGRLDAAQNLADDFAENDFFGGFGPEADSPGLALWGLEEVAGRLRKPEFDRRLWPHVRRKAALILEMLATDHPIRKPVTGPIVLAKKSAEDLDLVCRPSRDGLIIGRMDWQYPILFVNAVSYRGLLCAAALADRLGEKAEATAWRARAESLGTAWRACLATDETASANERTYICGLWPTWVVGPEAGRYRSKLRDRRDHQYTLQGQPLVKPLWTYFTIAEAHQWLYDGRPDQAWETLNWFWDHQASPGLYTWWEGSGQENDFGGWWPIRGWINPPNITPHYWTAAEVLCLQTDLMTYIDESAPEPAIVVGMGIPRPWLGQAMHARNIPTKQGVVSWSWEGSKMRVKVKGPRGPVRIGAAFPPNTPVDVEFEGQG